MLMKNKNAPAPMLTWSLCESTVCRRLRVGPCPVLTVKAVYPTLTLTAEPRGDELLCTEATAERFNACYRAAAEAFVDAALEQAEPSVRAEYEAAGPEAAHRFMGRMLVCRMTAAPEITRESSEPPEKCTCLIVTVERLFGVRRGAWREQREIAWHVWRFPEGTLSLYSPKSKKSYEKLLKK